MKKITAMMVVAMMLLAAQMFAQDKIAPMPRPTDDLEVRVWTNKAEGKSFGQGEHIIVYFQTNRDSYVTIYDLDTRGDINLLFPLEYDDPSYVEGGRVYSIPDYYDDYELVVEGPLGHEYIQAVASLDPFDVPAWPSKFFKYDEYYPLHADRDAVDFLNYVNHRYFPFDNCGARCAVDYTHFEVRRDWSYDWDDYYDQRDYYRNDRYYYDPWGWCGTIYIGYPYGGAVYINGIFYGYAPLFVPRIVVGWHHFQIWYDGFYWYDQRFRVYAGGWYDYDCDDVRYKGDHNHYGFKPKRRGSPEEVAGRFEPDRRKTVFTKKEGYITKDKYLAERTKTPVRSTDNKYFKGVNKDMRGTKTYGSDGKKVNVTNDAKNSKSYKKNAAWNDYNSPKVSTEKKKSDNSGKEIKSTGVNSKKTKKSTSSSDYSKGKSSGSSDKQPIFKPKSSNDKKSSGSSKGNKGSDKTNISTGSSKKPSGSSTSPKSSGGSSGYSKPSGGSAPSGGSKSSGGSRSGGGKKDGRR
ncbi:MAG: DUF4384 domain-containing protein [candidate division Zixibacteria bacterium]|nr:DUF4384 domain-containing protein [candidate division Zixibacteria bacterium]MBU2626953.1 DUF4384 domain-containing protein [candidate division Zixibacteria bacterium]